MSYALLGREKEARAIVEEFIMRNPNFRVKAIEMTFIQLWKNQADRAFYADGMRKAGFPG